VFLKSDVLTTFKGRILEAGAALTQEPLQSTGPRLNCMLHIDRAPRKERYSFNAVLSYLSLYRSQSVKKLNLSLWLTN
jgi:hypothetical protein